jgi:hypothetical protein
LHLKIAVSIVLLFGLLASAPAFAKQAHAPHAAAPPKGDTNAGSAKPAEPIGADVTVLTPRGGFTPANKNVNTSQKLLKKENFTRRLDVTAPIRPVVRNAIGQPVQPRNVMVKAPHLTPSVRAPGAVPKTVTRTIVPAPPISPSTIGRTTFHPVTTAGISSTGRIDGTRLIRPSAASMGLGGPNHALGGINGTTVRTTH